MAHPIKLLGAATVCEVDWIVLPDALEPRKAEISKLIRDLRPSHKGVLRAGVSHILGLANTSKASKLQGRRITAAAAWLAASRPQNNIVFAHELEGGQIWLCICQGGAPKPRGDVLLGLRSLEDRLVELIPEPQSYVFMTDSASVQDELGHWPWLYHTLDDLLAKRPPRSAQLAPIGIHRSWLWMAVLGIAAIASVMGYSQWRAAQQREAARLAAERAAAEPQIPPEQRYLAQFRTWYQSEPRVNGLALAQSTWALAQGLEINVNGWVLTEVRCEPARCSASYRRQPMAGDLQASQIGASGIQMEVGLAHASFARTVPGNRLADNLTPPGVAGLFPVANRIQSRLISTLHRFADLGLTASHTPLRPLSGINLPTSPLQVSLGGWSFAADPDAMLDTLQELGPQLYSSQCVIEVGERIAMKMQGEYLEAVWHSTPKAQ